MQAAKAAKKEFSAIENKSNLKEENSIWGCEGSICGTGGLKGSFWDRVFARPNECWLESVCLDVAPGRMLS